MKRDVYEIASEQSKDPIYTFHDVDSILLKGLDCVVCLESAADMLGYSNGGYRSCIKVYSEKDFHIPYIKCYIVKDLKDVPYIEKEGVKVSPIEVAINDMLERDTTDEQVLYETFATYYCENNNSYNGLNIPRKLELKANQFKEEGKLFYGS